MTPMEFILIQIIMNKVKIKKYQIQVDFIWGNCLRFYKIQTKPMRKTIFCRLQRPLQLVMQVNLTISYASELNKICTAGQT